MNLETLQKEMITAMKEKNKSRKDTISSLIGAIKKMAIDKKCKDNITEDLVNEVILKEKKTVQEMIDTCPKERTELLKEYTERLNVINEFAPQLITDENVIKTIIIKLLSDSKNVYVDLNKSNKCQIMKIIMPAMKGKADMKIVNKAINELLK